MKMTTMNGDKKDLNYNETISLLIGADRVIDWNTIFSKKIGRFVYIIYLPFELYVRKTKTFFPDLNFYSIDFRWRKPSFIFDRKNKYMLLGYLYISWRFNYDKYLGRDLGEDSF